MFRPLSRSLVLLASSSLVVLAAALWVLALPAAAQDEASAEAKKTVVLGFDGVDADLAAGWMDEGKLPNLAKLRDQGTFAPLMPTIPSQTPVSWSTFATGLEPGRHGVFDFLRRNPETYYPELALITEGERPLLWGERNPLFVSAIAAVVLLVLFGLLVGRMKSGKWKAVSGLVVLLLVAGAAYGIHWVVDAWVPTDLPTVENPRQGETFWEMLGNDGHRVRVLRLPQNFPPNPFHHGEILTGLGTPDLSLRVGKPFYFTSELFFQAEGGGDFSLEVVELVDNRGEIPTTIKGPPNKLFREEGAKLSYVEVPMNLTVSEDRSSLKIEVSGNELTMEPGQWSDWIRVKFPFNPLIHMTGIGRFHLISVEPEVRLYLSPLQFDPHDLPPSFRLSEPPEFAAELTEKDGLYKTIGWAVDTWSLDEGTIDEGLFLEDVDMTASRYELMLQEQLDAPADWDVLVHYFEFTDRVQHMMFRLFDEEHPIYDEEKAALYGDSILEAYQRMDEIVGRVMETLPDSRLFVVSDHGFSSWRWSMNYNTWLVEHGYLVLNDQEEPGRYNLEMLFDQGEFYVNVDWSRSRAYAMGFGNIFVNLEGREAKGIVPQEDYDALVEEIRQGLLEFEHEETGLKPVAHVFRRTEAYESFDPRIMPDMIATNADYYRAGWQDTLGGIGAQIVEPNTKRWSGDHCSLYPPLVEGILFSNEELNLGDGAYMGDLAPTMLDLYGVEPPVDFDGKSLVK